MGQKKQLQYSKTRIDRAGVTLRQFLAGEPLGHDEILEAAAIVDHWRGCHAYPLNKAAAGLRSMVKTAGADPADIAQRLKRFVTIVDKLERHRV